MPDFSPNSLSTLDKVRTSRGNRELSNYFYKFLRTDTTKAISLINEDTLSFPSLFLLEPQINRTPINRYLNTRNKNVLMLTNAINSKNFSRFSYISRNIGDNTPSILKWILETGKDESGLRGQYDKILDSCSLILVREYKDNSILPVVRDIIYNRNRKGLFIHDLVWAFFESRDPNCIMMLAEGLKSDDKKDVEISKKLLRFIPCVKNNTLNEEMQYLSIFYWFRDNFPFLYYTDESFQQKPNPSPFEVSLASKYLYKKVSVDNGIIESELTEDELRIENIFNSIDEKNKLLLSNYSFILHNQNIYLWNNWIHNPVSEQLKIACARLGGTLC
ncbi:hypothetical protein [Acetivibrio cellulolyticus]|uniref:hypothetical protein n=1 Tax=Acetivibrio cellulolyticus TaxID=35830 RepID=UPI0001E2FBAB|nr:hypothetical protein [Acetivibrio cellulolyticus]